MLLLTAIALVGGVAFSCWLARAGYERHTGYLQAKSRTITAGREARIASIDVRPGQIVEPGAALIQLKDLELEEQRVRKQREITSLEAELTQVRAKATIELSARRQALEAEVFDTRLKAAQYLKQQFSQRAGAVVVAPVQVDPFEEAAEPKYLTMSHHDRRQAFAGPDATLVAIRREAALQSIEISGGQIDLCHQHLAQLKDRLDNLEEQILEAMGAKVAQARLNQAKEELAQLDREQQSLTLTAEVHGTVGVFLKEPGEHVSAHEPIVELLDEDQPYLMVRVPSSQIADFQPGAEVALVFPGGVSGSGRVESIPPQVAPMPGVRELGLDLVTVHVAPAGRLWPSIPFGSVVEVRCPKGAKHAAK
jgi:multidrug resistance efflux pump